MPNGREHLKYDDFGGHSYSKDGTSDCKYHCGCWAGPCRSGSKHAGVGPFGRCPRNISRDLPEAFGKPLNQEEILEDFVNGRLQKPESELCEANKWKGIAMKARAETKIDLQTNVELLEKKNKALEAKLSLIKEAIMSRL